MYVSVGYSSVSLLCITPRGVSTAQSLWPYIHMHKRQSLLYFARHFVCFFTHTNTHTRARARSLSTQWCIIMFLFSNILIFKLFCITRWYSNLCRQWTIYVCIHVAFTVFAFYILNTNTAAETWNLIVNHSEMLLARNSLHIIRLSLFIKIVYVVRSVSKQSAPTTILTEVYDSIYITAIDTVRAPQIIILGICFLIFLFSIRCINRC